MKVDCSREQPVADFACTYDGCQCTSVRTLDGLRAHISVAHLKYWPFECCECGTLLPTERRLTAHARRMHKHSRHPLKHKVHVKLKHERTLARHMGVCIKGYRAQESLQCQSLFQRDGSPVTPAVNGSLNGTATNGHHSYELEDELQEFYDSKIADASLMEEVERAARERLQQQHTQLVLKRARNGGSSASRRRRSTGGSGGPKRSHARVLVPCAVCKYKIAQDRMPLHMKVHDPNGRAIECPTCPSTYFPSRDSWLMHRGRFHTERAEQTRVPEPIRRYAHKVGSNGQMTTVRVDNGSPMAARGTPRPRPTVPRQLPVPSASSSTPPPPPPPSASRRMTNNSLSALDSLPCGSLRKFGKRRRHSLVSASSGSSSRLSTPQPQSASRSRSHRRRRKSGSHESTFRRLPCATCGKIMPEYKLEWHQKVHDPAGRPIACALCPSYYIKSDQLRQHMLQMHARPSELLRCTDCGEKVNKKMWQVHVDRHQNPLSTFNRTL